MESTPRFRILSGLSGVAGVILLILSFVINGPPPAGASDAELIQWGQQHFAAGLWGAWLQAVGPILIVLFAFSLVHLSRHSQSLAGWMTFFGATVLATVSLIEVTFYVSAWFTDPALMPRISLRLISAVQHLYFTAAAPALFLPLGIILIRSTILPRIFGYLALLLAAVFAVLGAAFTLTLVMPAPVTAVAGLQALWWLAAAITLMIRPASLIATGSPLR